MSKTSEEEAAAGGGFVQRYIGVVHQTTGLHQHLVPTVQDFRPPVPDVQGGCGADGDVGFGPVMTQHRRGDVAGGGGLVFGDIQPLQAAHPRAGNDAVTLVQVFDGKHSVHGQNLGALHNAFCQSGGRLADDPVACRESKAGRPAVFSDIMLPRYGLLVFFSSE